jgi:hypothetical protein
LVQPKSTALEGDPNNNGYPYLTYYFRTHFTVTNVVPGMALLFSAFVDDGAVFYLNGSEIYRLRMDPEADPITNDTLALGPPPCTGGDAICPDEFMVSGDAVAALVAGDNTLAVEVHNYSSLSPDITFGTSLSYTTPFSVGPTLQATNNNGKMTFSWDRGGFVLQESTNLPAAWTDVPGPVVIGPYTVGTTNKVKFFQLNK